MALRTSVPPDSIPETNTQRAKIHMPSNPHFLKEAALLEFTFAPPPKKKKKNLLLTFAMLGLTGLPSPLVLENFS